MSRPVRFALRHAHWLAGVLIVLATLAAYARSFGGPFVFDDPPAIPNNPTIRHLWPPWPALSPPAGRGLTVEGRPFLNFSLAVNYAISGKAVWSYHALNLAIHILAAMTLFGLMCRTLQNEARARRSPPGEGGPDSASKTDASPTLLAFAIALLWTLHPLQTEAVTYVIQRAESLMGLCYLLTLYCFIRGVEADGAGAAFALRASAAEKAARRGSLFWFGLSWLACLFGMATKEVMVSAPIIVFLYDRTFVSGSFREAWRRRWGYYGALVATWGPLAFFLLRGGGSRSGTAGLGTAVSGWRYALTQAWAIEHYLRLVFWPHPLVFDYGTYLARDPWKVAPAAVLVVGLVVATGFTIFRRPVGGEEIRLRPLGFGGRGPGFAGASFLAILAPSSSVLPVATQTIAEHRMYLPLAAVLALAVLGLHRLAGRAGVCLGLALAVGGGIMTAARNRDYQSDLALFRANVAARPGNPRAHYNLGTVLYRRREVREAIGEFEAALRLDPAYADAHNNLGNALLKLGRTDEAMAHYRAALRSDPDHVAAHYDLGNALVEAGRIPEAIVQYEAAGRLRPDAIEPRTGMAGVFVLQGRWADAIRRCDEALRLAPDDAEAHYDRANALAGSGRRQEALREYAEALRLGLDEAKVHYNFANVLAEAGRNAEAAEHYETALQLKPDYPEAHYNLGNVLAGQHRLAGAIAHYREAIRLRPDNAAAHNNLGGALLESGQLAEAAEQFRETLRLRPDFEESRRNLERLQTIAAPER